MTHLPTSIDLPDELQGVLDALTDSDSDDEVIDTALESVPGPLEERAILVAKSIQAARALVSQLKAEEERLAARRGRIERRIERSQRYLLLLLKTGGVSRINDPLYTVRLAKNPPAVESIDPVLLPDLYWKEWVEREPNRAAIIAAWKQGQAVPGAVVVQRERVSIR